VSTHRDGVADLAAEAARYEQILAADPDQWDALYLYGAALLQLGRFREAVDVFERVSRLRPEVPDTYNNLGVAHQGIGDHGKAARAYRAAIALNPDFDLAHANYARLLESTGRLEEAEFGLRRALALKPANAAYARQLVGVLGRCAKWSDAVDVLHEATRLHQQNHELQMDLAAAFVHLERLEEAADVYRAVIDKRPDFAEAHSSLAFVLERQGRLDEALNAAESAVALRPEYSEGFNNLGTVLRSLHRLDDACRAFRRALELNPDFALAEFNLGTTLLLTGRYAEGWAGYRQHGRVAGTAAPGARATEWDGAPIPGRRLLVYADQGAGDAIQFARFLPLCKQRSQAHILFRCQPALRRLLTRCRGVDELFTNEDDLPPFDLHTSLASLPGLFAMTVEQVGLAVPYLMAHREVPARVGQLLDATRGERRVGLVWQGNPRQARDVVRSCPLDKLLPLLGQTGIRFLSLQCDAFGRSQLAASSAADRVPDVGALLEDFADTAAVLERIDLLITVDTAIAHLAGALGRPVWTMLCHTPDWRWHLDRSDSPWYPTMRLFRQPAWGDWGSVVEQIQNELRTLDWSLGSRCGGAVV
jgi:Flp pilus assembly protein TadD